MPCHGSTSSSNLGSLVLQKIIEARNERRKKKKKGSSIEQKERLRSLKAETRH